ncbi:hypothetical protein Tsubulata_000806 [Turnera subulata]|uniref:DUF7903 domain-containing protein n=1 Tax=Turnera subulata TaxID=218843 RepID=A0A9Q0JLH0_9ROSI|nr:hypothetical protein Tsubulata_000806 [Turnera subulata]
MAYIPPHKRHSKDKGKPSPTPELLVPQFKRNLNFRSPKPGVDRSGKIIYADNAISRWFAVGLDDNDQIPPHVNLEPVSVEEVERKSGEKPLILVNKQLAEENTKKEGNCSRSPAAIITERVLPDLFLSFQTFWDKVEHQGSETVKPTLVARICKILFMGSPSVKLESVNKNQVAEGVLRQLKRTIHTDFPPSYMENIVKEVIPKIGVDFEDEKEVYYVKVELNQVRQMVADISCLDKDLDLRVMLCTKRILTDLTEDEINNISYLIDAAIVDSDVKGGLRWPMGKSSSGERYSVVGVWHTVNKIYSNASLRLKEQRAERASISEMLEESLRLIWSHFLCCERYLE